MFRPCGPWVAPRGRRLGLCVSVCCIACGGTVERSGGVPAIAPLQVLQRPQEPEPSPPVADSPPILIRGGTVMSAAAPAVSPGYVLMSEGRIAAVGTGDSPVPAGATVVDADGKFVTPGIIDAHSHLGVSPAPGATGDLDGNEYSEPITAEVWAEHAFWPQDPGLWRALGGGVTLVQVLPGSANLVGGRTLVLKLRPGTSARGMRVAAAPQGLKMACGENPKRTHGERGGPVTRMGNVARLRRALQRATEYRDKQARYERALQRWRAKNPQSGSPGGKAEDGDGEDPPERPPRDLRLETLVGLLEGDILAHVHCYRADEMHVMLDVAKAFGFKIRAFHHGLEAYKLRRRLASEHVTVATWSDWWGFKIEAFDGVPQNAALLAQAGARAIVHSDSPIEMRRLNQEAAKALAAGRKLGIELDEQEALRWITANPAWALGIDGQVGTLEPGKMADVVIWDRHPFSVYARAEKVFIDGHLVFDRADPESWPISDFELGLQAYGEVVP